jgi:hypothetical protein
VSNMTIASQVLMVRPYRALPNAASSQTNFFQSSDNSISEKELNNLIFREFDQMVNRLLKFDVDVVVKEEPDLTSGLDAIFPNNWISFLPDATTITYPMLVEHRRLERREEWIAEFSMGRRHIDLSYLESEELFLEGTGSLVIDHSSKRGFANRSPRTSEKAVRIFEEKTGYTVLVFDAVDEKGRPIYHTNVVMALVNDHAIWCTEAVGLEDDRRKLRNQFELMGLSPIEIDYNLMRKFAANILQVESTKGVPLIIMSYESLANLPGTIRRQLENASDILDVHIPTVERYGGGSARCMLAEVF